MSKKQIVRIVIGCVLGVLNTIIFISTVDNWYSNGLLATINGFIIIPIVYPPVVKWAYSKRHSHRMLAVFIIGFIIMQSSIWFVFTISKIAGVMPW